MDNFIVFQKYSDSGEEWMQESIPLSLDYLQTEYKKHIQIDITLYYKKQILNDSVITNMIKNYIMKKIIINLCILLNVNLII